LDCHRRICRPSRKLGSNALDAEEEPTVARIREQPAREHRILFEIVVDAYGESERALGWYYYLEEKMDFPFQANCISARATSPLEVGSQVEVLGMAPEDDCMSEVLVFVRYGTTKRSKLAVPLAQLECLSTNVETRQAVEDWHYWVARGYEY
jgi:hypothetical protein